MIVNKKSPAQKSILTREGYTLSTQIGIFFCAGAKWTVWCLASTVFVATADSALGTPFSEAVIHLLIYPADKRRNVGMKGSRPVFDSSLVRRCAPKVFFFWHGRARAKPIYDRTGPADHFTSTWLSISLQPVDSRHDCLGRYYFCHCAVCHGAHFISRMFPPGHIWPDGSPVSLVRRFLPFARFVEWDSGFFWFFWGFFALMRFTSLLLKTSHRIRLAGSQAHS